MATTMQINPRAVARLRYETGMARNQLAHAAGMSESTLRAWERGMTHQRAPRASAVRRLADALSAALGRKVEVGELLHTPTPDRSAA